MKIATYNINGIKARLPRLKDWLAETQPTVACLQEIKCQDDSFSADEFAELGYRAIWHGQKSRSEEHTSELQSLMRISYAVFCLKKNTFKTLQPTTNISNPIQKTSTLVHN